MYSLQQITEITGTRFIGKQNYKVSYFLNDSRNLQSAEDTLFVALKTSRNNGHNYIPNLVEAGVKSFLVQEGEINAEEYLSHQASFIISPNPLKTLQLLATYHRQQFSIPVIGITGSNGKTVVKEWLYQLLKPDYNICRSPKSFNSQIGVPLSVLNLNASHTLAIFEAGISQPNEMEILAGIIRPTMGVLTSIGSAHDEGFKDRGHKIHEKLKLVEGCETVIINGLAKTETNLSANTIFVSEEIEADLKLIYLDGKLKLISPTSNYEFIITFSDKASIYNVATCVAILLKLGYKEEEIAARVYKLQPVALRLEIKMGVNNSLVINDYYNSDLDSIRIALSHLKQQNRRPKKLMIVSDIEQSGMPSSLLYRQVAELLAQNKIDQVVGIGTQISNHRPLFKSNSLFFQDTKSFVDQFHLISHHFSEATILLKGARSFGFENISRLLQLKSHDTVFEVNLNKLVDNVNYYRSLIQPHTKVMCMVKAMGYGSGSVEVAKVLQHIGVEYLAVAYADEGVELRQAQVLLPIMVMNPETDALEDIINNRLEPEIYNFRTLRTFLGFLDNAGLSEPYPIHLKIDTGMHRLGFEEQDLLKLVNELKLSKQIKVKSIFSHLAASDNEKHDGFTQQQIKVFEAAFQLIEKELGYKVIKHICNSGGISRFKQAHYDMVRLGIGMYGVGVNDSEQNKLQNVGTLKTRISQIKQVEKGQSVSYNRSGNIENLTRIATVPIGYADGINRLLGNAKHGVYINGHFCKTVGNICMDMCMVDVTGVNCEEGDEVIIFENSKQINDLAKALNSIPYEVLTNVSGRVKRVYVQE